MLLAAAVVAMSGDAHAQDAEAYYQQAIELFNEGQYQDALVSLDKAIAIAPDEAVFHCNRGAILLKLKDAAEALGALEVCLARYEGDEAEIAQIDAEVQALRRVVRLMEPSARRVAIQSASTPDAGAAPAPISKSADTTPIIYAAWGFAGLAAVSLAAAVIVDQGTLSRIDEFEEVAEDGQDRQRYNALEDEINQRQLAVGAMAAVSGIALLP